MEVRLTLDCNKFRKGPVQRVLPLTTYLTRILRILMELISFKDNYECDVLKAAMYKRVALLLSRYCNFRVMYSTLRLFDYQWYVKAAGVRQDDVEDRIERWLRTGVADSDCFEEKAVEKKRLDVVYNCYIISQFKNLLSVETCLEKKGLFIRILYDSTRVYSRLRKFLSTYIVFLFETGFHQICIVISTIIVNAMVLFPK